MKYGKKGGAKGSMEEEMAKRFIGRGSKGQVSKDELDMLRGSSPTGGALGQVSAQELEMLKRKKK